MSYTIYYERIGMSNPDWNTSKVPTEQVIPTLSY